MLVNKRQLNALSLFAAHMAISAYLRVSTDRQDLDNQRFAVGEYCTLNNLPLGEVVTDTKSGKLSWRQRDLAILLKRLLPGDTLVTPELSRLSRSLQDVFSFLAEAAQRKIIVHVIKGNFVIDGSLQSTVLVTAFGLAAEIEREFISQRTKEALARKKREGQKLGRPVGRKSTKTKLTGRESEVDNYLKLSLPATSIAKLVGVHPETIRRYSRSNAHDQIKNY
jgi:DNA invertase Pin-like site-specific DNA recombinase